MIANKFYLLNQISIIFTIWGCFTYIIGVYANIGWAYAILGGAAVIIGWANAILSGAAVIIG